MRIELKGLRFHAFHGVLPQERTVGGDYEVDISVDYAIMERADEIYVYPVDMGWSDLGSWSSLHSRLPQDQHGNATVGANIRLFDSNNCIVHTSGLKQVVVQGLDGYIVAERDGVLLVCKISEEQRIKLFH